MTAIVANKVQVRYNTASDGTHLAWRLIIDGKEHLVNHIEIYARCATTRDWIEEIGTFKHHLTITNCKVTINENMEANIESA